MANNTNGLIYFKLDSSKIYKGDETKNCGLLGEEIDSNFYFLRGYDIKDVQFNENKDLVVTRLNGETLIAKAIPEVVKPEYGFEYDTETGVLTIITPDGKEIIVNGFITEKFITDYCATYIDERVDRNVYHDYTLEGTGVKELPLKVTNITKTGRYRPAIKLIDTTKNEKLPTTNIGKNDRYVTKEVVSRFGALYPLDGVVKIQQKLDELQSGWRVPTKADWDKLLNTIDCERPNHDSPDSNVDLGKNAGALLKSTNLWYEYDGQILSDDYYKFTIYPVGYAGDRGRNFYGSFGELSAFWTSTEEDNHRDMYVKIFGNRTTGVLQNTWGGRCYLSLRLVKDYNPKFGYNETEVIDGVTVNCIHIDGQDLIWTNENIALLKDEYEPFIPTEWEKYYNTGENLSTVRYFVNDWNGNSWDKKEILEGEGIVLYEGANGRMHEWMVVDGVLIDSAVFLKSEFQADIDHLAGKLATEIDDRIKGDNELLDKIQQESESRQQSDNDIIEKFKTITEDLNNKLDSEIQERNKSVDSLKNSIEDERDAREYKDNELSNQITDIQNKLKDVNDNLSKQIEKESQTRQDEDKVINDRITTEIGNLTQVDNELQKQIKQEILDRENGDKQLEDSLSILTDKVNQEVANLHKEDNAIKQSIEQTKDELSSKLDVESQIRKNEDDKLQQQITQNSVVSSGGTIIVNPNSTGLGTDLQVNIANNSNIKIDGNGCIYFDGNFGTF